LLIRAQHLDPRVSVLEGASFPGYVGMRLGSIAKGVLHLEDTTIANTLKY